MNTQKVDLLIHIKHFTVCLWAREQSADLGYDKLLDNAKNHETAIANYHHDKENMQDSSGFPSIVTACMDAIHPVRATDILP